MQNMLAAYHRLLECADAAAKVLPPGQSGIGWEKLGVAHLSNVVLLEFARVCTWNPVALPRKHNFPGAQWRSFQGQGRSLSDTLKQEWGVQYDALLDKELGSDTKPAKAKAAEPAPETSTAERAVGETW